MTRSDTTVRIGLGASHERAPAHSRPVHRTRARTTRDHRHGLKPHRANVAADPHPIHLARPSPARLRRPGSCAAYRPCACAVTRGCADVRRPPARAPAVGCSFSSSCAILSVRFNVLIACCPRHRPRHGVRAVRPFTEGLQQSRAHPRQTIQKRGFNRPARPLSQRPSARFECLAKESDATTD